MKLGRFLLVWLLCSLSLYASSGPDDRKPTDPKAIASAANPAARPAPVDDLYVTRQVSNAAWSPNGREIIFSSNMAGRFNLWKVNAAGGWPMQLTQSDDRQYGSTWSPDGKWIVYQQDHAGDEMYDLYAIPSNGGEVVNLTHTAEVREVNPRFSPDGKWLAMDYKPKESSAVDIALLDWNTRAVRRLTQEASPKHLWSTVGWSPDGKTLYANRAEVSFTDSDVYAVDAASGKRESLTPHKGNVLYQASSISPEGKTLLITSTEKGGYQNVALLDVASKKLTWVTDTKWEAGSGDFSPDGKSFTYFINEDGRADIYLVDRASGRHEKLDFSGGVNSLVATASSYSPQGDQLMLSHESSSQPADIWIYDLGSRKPRQLTFSTIASLDPRSLPPSQLVYYKSFDGKIISALLWMPFNLKRDGSNPALVLPHGGPTGQTQDDWSPHSMALASRGYICIAPNVRGSTGYGMEFQKANYQDLGGGDLQDEVYAVKFLESTGYVDARKVGIAGGSYGGFMTLMAIGKAPDVWAAGVEFYGIINWYTMLQHEDPLLQEYEKTLLGDPEKDRKAYEASSPIKYIHNAKAPLLVLQGDNDIRVPKEEAQQVVDLLKKDGKTVEVHYYPNEGHGFSKRENQIDAIRRTLEWFDRYLKGEKTGGN